MFGGHCAEQNIFKRRLLALWRIKTDKQEIGGKKQSVWKVRGIHAGSPMRCGDCQWDKKASNCVLKVRGCVLLLRLWRRSGGARKTVDSMWCVKGRTFLRRSMQEKASEWPSVMGRVWWVMGVLPQSYICKEIQKKLESHWINFFVFHQIFL